MVTNIQRKRIYDVCVVGSGAAGGFMAKELTEGGANTILLEAGRRVEASELPIHDWPYELPRHGFKFNRQAALYPDDIGPIEYQTQGSVGVDRIRVLGGRTLHWNATCLRFSENDFRERSVNGIEEDWPLTYRELAPFYSHVERVIGLCGTRENLAVLPDGEYVSPPPNLRCSEMIARRACRKLGLRLIPARKAVTFVRQNGRGPCHFCGHCMDVCDVGAIATSVNTLIPRARATKRLTLKTNALARQILLDEDGKVSGVSIIDRATGKEETIHARLVVVSCGTIESARLLLNSACEKFPNGLANSQDVVGRYLHGHSTSALVGYLKDLTGQPPNNNDGATDHSYITRLDDGLRDYKGGFQIQPQTINFMFPFQAGHVSGFGGAFKKRVRDLQPGLFFMGGFGKVLARSDNRVTVNSRKLDQHGIPTPIVKFEFGENDRLLVKDLEAHMKEVLRVAPVELTLDWGGRMSGFASHEVGACRMGADPKTSVLNSFCQTHEIPNLFVVDGSCFTTFPEKNPTLTIMALAARSARHIIEQKRKRNL